jgi:hypothetical protein
MPKINTRPCLGLPGEAQPLSPLRVTSPVRRPKELGHTLCLPSKQHHLLFRFPAVSSMFLSLLRVAVIALACTGVCAGTEMANSKASRPNPLVTVQLTGGRLLSGEIDSQTDEAGLLLRWSNGNAGEIRSAIPWDRVVRAEIDGLIVRGSDLRDTVAAIRRTHPKPPVASQDASIMRSPRAQHVPPEPPRGDSISPPAPDTRIRSLAIEAALANWDSGAEVDGLILFVAPLDASGNLTPVRATIEVELTALRITAERALGIPDRIARWTQTISPEDFGPRGAVCRLPFQGVHPAFDGRFKVRGALHVRLSVPGQGVLEATEDLRIRPYSAFRDYLEQATGRRYLPEEHAGSR